MVDFPGYLFNYFDEGNILFHESAENGTGMTVPRLDLLYNFGICKPAFLSINRNDTEEDQIKTLIHEVLHYHPKFISETAQVGRIIKDETEVQIEQMALEIYNSREDIVESARQALTETKGLFGLRDINFK